MPIFFFQSHYEINCQCECDKSKKKIKIIQNVFYLMVYMVFQIIVITTFIPYNVTKADSIYTWSNICFEQEVSVIAFSQCLHPVYKIDCFVNVHFVSS